MSVELANESGTSVDEPALVQVARFVLDRMGVSPLAELSLLLVDTRQMAELHEHWMNLPGPTDVLAFRMDELDLRGAPGVDRAPSGAGDDQAPVLLGDVVLCPEVAAAQAVEAEHGTEDELQLLCTHGVLHLLGFDHEEPGEHQQMFDLQGTLLTAWKAARTP